MQSSLVPALGLLPQIPRSSKLFPTYGLQEGEVWICSFLYKAASSENVCMSLWLSRKEKHVQFGNKKLPMGYHWAFESFNCSWIASISALAIYKRVPVTSSSPRGFRAALLQCFIDESSLCLPHCGLTNFRTLLFLSSILLFFVTRQEVPSSC